MSGRMIHESVRMIPNPFWPRMGQPFMRDPYFAPKTYRCREGQVRGKAAKKAARRARQLTRESHRV